MAIKSFRELSHMDISEHVSKKPVFKKDKATGTYNKVGELDYLNWADCLDLLHENGAERVTFGNVRSKDDHPVFLLAGGIPFVRVYVEVDGDRRELDYPVIDGSANIGMDKMTQGDVHNASQRAFVKAVAINWGLGLSLWQKEERAADKDRKPQDNLEYHNIWAIKTRVEQFITAKIQSGMSMDDILSQMGVTNAQFKNIMKYFDGIAALEQRLSRI